VPATGTITGYTGSATVLDIPSSIIGASVKTIADNAFNGKNAITSVTIPSSVTTIGDSAFNGCTSLTTVIMEQADPAKCSVTNGHYYTFPRDNAGFKIYVPAGSVDSYKTKTAQHWNVYADYIASSLTTAEGYVFVPTTGTITGYTGSATSLTIPRSIVGASVKIIAPSAFDGYRSLRTITIPSSVTSIGWSAFSGCYNLTCVIMEQTNPALCSVGSSSFPSNNVFIIGVASSSVQAYKTNTTQGWSAYANNFKGVIVAGSYIFEQSTGTLVSYAGTGTEIVIPSTIAGIPVTSIGVSAFRGCTGLTSITIPSSVTTIGSWAFYECTRLVSVTIPSSVTEIGMGVFQNCIGLMSVFFETGSNLTTIQDSFFSGCTSLTKITIPRSVSFIGDGAFIDCRDLTSITIPSSVTSIGNGAFAGCAGLKSITIPRSVTIIGNGAFAGCTKLTSVIMEQPDPTRCFVSSSSSAFPTSNPGFKICVPVGSVNDYKTNTANGWNTYADYIIYSR
ncbi:MAG: leucine-rich repeat domain-containing protein, partial [Clostridia bacterium]